MTTAIARREPCTDATATILMPRRSVLALPLAALLPALPTHRPTRSRSIIDDELADELADWEAIAQRRGQGNHWPTAGMVGSIDFSPDVRLIYSSGDRGYVRHTWRTTQHELTGQDIMAGGWSSCRRAWVLFVKKPSSTQEI